MDELWIQAVALVEVRSDLQRGLIDPVAFFKVRQQIQELHLGEKALTQWALARRYVNPGALQVFRYDPLFPIVARVLQQLHYKIRVLIHLLLTAERTRGARQKLAFAVVIEEASQPGGADVVKHEGGFGVFVVCTAYGGKLGVPVSG